MSNDHIDEYEQGERVRTWLREHGATVFGGIALGLAALVGVQFLGVREESQRIEASQQFDRFVDALAADDHELATGIATALAEHHENSPYPAMSALRLAASRLQRDEAEEALALLDAALAAERQHAPELGQMLVLRAARIELVLGRAEAALARVAVVDLPAYTVLRHEIEGDAHVALGRHEQARQAYQQALTLMDHASPTRMLLELKLADVGGTPTPEA